MSDNPATVDADDTIASAIAQMHGRRIGAVLVTKNNELVGIITERDLVRICAMPGEHPGNHRVSEHMTRDPVTAQVTDNYNTVYVLMQINGIRHMPILDKDKLVGIVSIRDLIHFYQNKLESDYIEACERIESLKKLNELSAEDVLDSLFSEINKFKELSLTDPLTGLYNKRYFLARLREETARARRYKQDLSLIFCDIDHFKAINDNYGHHNGDLVLKSIGEIISGSINDLNVVSRLRKSDIVARYGGEEFIVILPETSAENALIVAEKIRKMVECYAFRIDQDVVHLSMSLGVSGLDDTVEAAEDLIRNADNAMYRAKENGRNRVAAYKK